ncbi:hypothetical protein D9M68_521610 [compost metagenome]
MPASTTATMVSVAGTLCPTAAQRASGTNISAAISVQWRSHTRRLPRRSVWRPLQIRIAIAPSCTAQRVAAMPDTPTWAASCRNTEAKLKTANWGAHRMPMATAMRQTRRLRNGLALSCAWRRADVGEARCVGSCSHRQVSQAEAKQSAARTAYTQRKPMAKASHGNTSAPSPPPRGTAVWRILIARPRSPSANHRITARPLAPLTLPPASPSSAMQAIATGKGGTRSGLGARNSAITASMRAVAPSPYSRTRRSPHRSAAAPHGSSDNAAPMPNAPSSRPSPPLSI